MGSSLTENVREGEHGYETIQPQPHPFHSTDGFRKLRGAWSVLALVRTAPRVIESSARLPDLPARRKFEIPHTRAKGLIQQRKIRFIHTYIIHLFSLEERSL